MRTHTSLKAKLLVLVVLAVGSAEAIVTGVALWQEAARYAAAKRETVLAEAHVLAAAVAEASGREDRAAIFQALRAIGDIEGLISVSVENARGDLLADLGATERLQGDLDIDEASQTIPLVDLLTTRSVRVTVPVVHGGLHVGRLRLIGDTSDLAARLVRTLLTALAGLGLSLVVAATIAWRMQRGIADPLHRLTTAMQRVGVSRDDSLSLAPSTIREVGILIGGFNAMLLDIKERDARIAASHAHLEEQVAERTLDLRAAKEAADTANGQKSDFLATMSHEIRTPMNGMLVMAELLAGADLPARARRYAEVIARSGQSLLAIINDILDLSKIEAGKLELESVSVDLAEAASTVLDLFYEKARAQKLDLAAKVDADLPRTIRGDPVRLNQVLGNFINNALKFTEAGGVHLDIARDPGAPGRVRFSVTDTGIGIAADKIETIFGAFSQADQSTTRRYGGTGLGLAICRKLVLAMGADIDVTSIPGGGSTFSFSLPASEIGDGLPWPRVVPGHEAPVVLLSIEGAFTQASAAYYFAEAGCVVRAANTHEVPSVIKGASLAVLDGAACTPAILRAARAAGSRVVALAAPGETARGFDHGAVDAVLARPLSCRDMRQVVAALIEGQAFAMADAAPTAEILPRFTGAHALVADDNAVNREVAAEALGRLGMTVDLVENGAEAVEAFEAKSYAIIFMDGSMPVLDGFLATRRIRAIEKESGAAPVPIIALTAHVIGTSSDEWMAAGMNGVLHKPFTLKALSDGVARLLPPGGEGDPHAPQTGGDVGGDVGVIDETIFDELRRFASTGRQDFVTRVITLYLDHAPKAAREIAARTADGPCEPIARSAHALKSMSLNIGARRVAALASEIETRAKQQSMPEATLLDQLDSLIAEACGALSGMIDPPAAGESLLQAS